MPILPLLVLILHIIRKVIPNMLGMTFLKQTLIECLFFDDFHTSYFTVC